MIPLRIDLGDTDFDALVETARGLIPVRAPEWTDYNYSDPGITLLELLCWTADAQIYALARDRRDERSAMAGLLGISPRGAEPATGTLFPAFDPADAQVVRQGTRLVASASAAPRLEVARDVVLHAAKIEAISVAANGRVEDRTAANEAPLDTYPPFGSPPSREAVLSIILSGDLQAGDTISLGFEIDRDAEAADDGLGGVIAAQRTGATETRAALADDSTGGLRRSGVMLVTLPAPPAGGRVELRFRPTGNALMPRLRRICINALPVVQRTRLKDLPFTGTGRAGQAVLVDPQDCFDADEPAVDRAWRLTRSPEAVIVEVEEGETLHRWEAGILADADAGARLYEVEERSDGRGISIRFGNGVNGRRPAEGAEIRVSVELSVGAEGVVRSLLDWRLDGERTAWRNREPIDGGENADALDDLLRRLRERVADERAITTSAQLLAAAEALSPAYGIFRAAVEEGWEPGRRRPVIPATRTLFVTRDPEGSETPSWTRAILRALRPRLPLGERLVVAVPEWLRFGIRVRATSAAHRVPREVQAAVRAAIRAKLPPGGLGGVPWPLGRDVSADEVAGLIRRVEGVGGQVEAVLVDGRGRDLAGGRLAVGRGQLPRLDEALLSVEIVAGDSR